jgi:hypothetical protein
MVDSQLLILCRATNNINMFPIPVSATGVEHYTIASYYPILRCKVNQTFTRHRSAVAFRSAAAGVS